VRRPGPLRPKPPLTVWVLPDGWFALRISDYKGLPGALKVLGTKVLSERSGPLSRSSLSSASEGCRIVRRSAIVGQRKEWTSRIATFGAGATWLPLERCG
jgi:hypothetical protein